MAFKIKNMAYWKAKNGSTGINSPIKDKFKEKIHDVIETDNPASDGRVHRDGSVHKQVTSIHGLRDKWFGGERKEQNTRGVGFQPQHLYGKGKSKKESEQTKSPTPGEKSGRF